MSVSVYTYIGNMIRIPEKKVLVKHKSCTNNKCSEFKKVVSKINFCPVCGNPIGFTETSELLKLGNYSLSWREFPGFEDALFQVAINHNVQYEDLYDEFEDKFVLVGKLIINSDFAVVLSEWEQDFSELSDEQIQKLKTEYFENETVIMFLEVLKNCLGEEPEVFFGAKLELSY